MIKDITIGQYYQANSIIHSLDPRTKFIYSFIYVILVFNAKTLTDYFLVVGLTLISIFLSKVPVGLILKGLKPVLFIVVFAFILNLFFTQGEVIFKWYFIKISKEGLYLSVTMASRLILLVIGTSLLTLTTTPIRLTDGLEKLLSPLKIIKFPAHEIALIITIALRYIPILISETDKIIKAQKSRGADFVTGSIIKKANNLMPLLIPLFVEAFKRADDLANAMVSRCYRGGEGRTRLKELKFRLNDILVIAFILAFWILMVCIK